MVGQVVDGHLPVRTVQDDDVAIRDFPGRPDGLLGGLLQPGQVLADTGGGIAAFVADLVDAEDLDIVGPAFAPDLVLQDVEVAELANAVASGGVPEIPGRDFLQVVAR